MKLNTKQKIALAKVASHIIRASRRLAGLGNEVRVRRGGLNWQLDLGEGIDFSIYLLGGFELATLKLYDRLFAALRPQVVFDIGANIGAHTLPLAQGVAPYGGKVHAFEPTQWAFTKLQHNLAINPDLERIVLAVQAMLVAERGEPVEDRIFSSWPLSDDPDLHTVHRGKRKETTGAFAITLDDYVAQQGLKRVDFIKLDVDGHEPEVLRGGGTMIEAFRPTLLMEWSPHLYRERPNVMPEALAWLQGLGYSVLDGATGVAISGGPAALDAMTPPGGSMNILLSPVQCKSSTQHDLQR